MKPPKLGNCSTNSTIDLPQPLITISKLKELYKSDKKGAIQEIKDKLKIVIEDEDSDFNDFVHAIDHDYNSQEIIDCLLFYTTEKVCRHIRERVKCSVCLSAFLTTSTIATDTLFFSSSQLPRSYEIFISPSKELIHPNRKMYNLVLEIEYLFRKYRDSRHCFDLIVKELTSEEIKISFPCKEHVTNAKDIFSCIIMIYLQIRMREFAKQEMAGVRKENQLKKKAAKLCST